MNKTSFVASFSIIIFLVALVSSCHKPTESEGPIDLEVTEETEVIDPDQTTINQVTPDQVVVSGFTDYQSGDVIVSEASTAAPEGILRKVQSVSVQSNQTVINTVTATLEDVFENADILINRALSTKDIKESRVLTNGVIFVPDAKNGEKFNYDINKQINLPTGQVMNITGALEAENSFDFNLEIRNSNISFLKYTHIAEQSSELAVSVNNSYNYSQNFDLYEHTFYPFTVWIGPVPLVFIPKITVVLNVSASGEASVSTSITQTATISAGLQLQDGQWSTFSDEDVSFDFQPPQLTSELSVSVGAGPDLSLMLFGIAGPYTNTRGSLILTADLMNTPWWTLTGKVKIDGGIVFDALGVEADYSSNLLNFTHVIAQATQNQCATPIFNPPGGTYQSAQSVSITCATGGVMIHYTTDGSEPGVNSQIYDSPINLYQTTTVRAKAYETGYIASATAIATYSIDVAHPIQMVYVPAGIFTMGDTQSGQWNDALPTHSVSLSSFYIGKYEVTQAEYSQFMQSDMQPAEGWTSGLGMGDNYPAYAITWYYILKYCNLRSIAEGLTPVYIINGSTNPLNWGAMPSSSNANWNAAICNWNANGYRLPTEAEWEYAARGAADTPDYMYSGSDNIDDVAWYANDNNSNSCRPVGTKAPNGLGIYDMSGNVDEWCWDWYSSYSNEALNNPTGPTIGNYRLVRGGGWAADDAAFECWISYRDSQGHHPDYDSCDGGFRLCRTRY